jgi:decaprenylphospho-beta-D-ribofuranose 2-oxidase
MINCPVAWIDCLARGASLGRGVLMMGNDCPVADVPSRVRNDPFLVPVSRTRSVPFYLPSGILNSYSVKAFNQLFYMKNKDGRKVVDYDSYFYPLDSVRNWNRIYGRRGFIQYQALFPPEASRRGLTDMLVLLAGAQKASFLAVLKGTGAANRGMLSFPMPGHTLALDIPNTGKDLIGFVANLDEIVLKHDGRLYLAKDATTSAAAFRRMYPRLEEFRRVKAAIDPENKFNSSQARRLGIAGSYE